MGGIGRHNQERRGHQQTRRASHDRTHLLATVGEIGLADMALAIDENDYALTGSDERRASPTTIRLARETVQLEIAAILDHLRNLGSGERLARRHARSDAAATGLRHDSCRKGDGEEERGTADHARSPEKTLSPKG